MKSYELRRMFCVAPAVAHKFLVSTTRFAYARALNSSTIISIHLIFIVSHTMRLSGLLLISLIGLLSFGVFANT